MYTLECSGIILGACGKEWIQKFKKDMVAAGLTDEEIKFQLRDP